MIWSVSVLLGYFFQCVLSWSAWDLQFVSKFKWKQLDQECFSVIFQGGEQVELYPDGAQMEVTAQNVHNYVRKYAEHRMLVVAEKALRVR